MLDMKHPRHVKLLAHKYHASQAFLHSGLVYRTEDCSSSSCSVVLVGCLLASFILAEYFIVVDVFRAIYGYSLTPVESCCPEQQVCHVPLCAQSPDKKQIPDACLRVPDGNGGFDGSVEHSRKWSELFPTS